MKEHCTYITTRKGGEFYIGKGVTAKVESGEYRGSGVLFRKKYNGSSPDEWLTVILGLYDTALDAYTAEQELVTEKTLEDPDCLNLRAGGLGGRNKPDSPETRMRKSIASKISNQRPDVKAKIAKVWANMSQESRLKHQAAQLRVQKEVQNRPEVNAKRSASLKAFHQNCPPEVKAQMNARRRALITPEEKRRRSDMAKQRWALAKASGRTKL